MICFPCDGPKWVLLFFYPALWSQFPPPTFSIIAELLPFIFHFSFPWPLSWVCYLFWSTNSTLPKINVSSILLSLEQFPRLSLSLSLHTVLKEPSHMYHHMLAFFPLHQAPPYLPVESTQDQLQRSFLSLHPLTSVEGLAHWVPPSLNSSCPGFLYIPDIFLPSTTFPSFFLLRLKRNKSWVFDFASLRMI